LPHFNYHHGLFHRYRGDNYSEMIPAQYQDTAIEKLGIKIE